jgi:co-chaperonin GroES (HSP10)
VEPGTLSLVRPFWGRVTVAESTVDEDQRASGLVLPVRYEGDDGVRRGIVLDVAVGGYASDAVDCLEPGMLIYFRRSVKIDHDVLVVELSDVLAYEVVPPDALS